MGWLAALAVVGAVAIWRLSSSETEPSAPEAPPPITVDTAPPAPLPTERETASSAEIAKLSPLPPIDRIPKQVPKVGSRLRPALFLGFREKPLVVVTQAYSATWRTYSGAWAVLIDGKSGFQPVLESPTEKVTRVACTMDLVRAAQLEDDPTIALEKLIAGCKNLGFRLGAKPAGALNENVVKGRVEKLSSLRKEAGAVVDVQLVSEAKAFRAQDVYRIAEALGFLRSDFGSFAWSNTTGVGSDRLITLRPASAPFQFDFERSSGSYAALSFGFDIDEVPLPDLVAERMLTAIATFRKHVGGHLENAQGKPIEDAEIRRGVKSSIDKLEGSGLLVPVKMAGL